MIKNDEFLIDMEIRNQCKEIINIKMKKDLSEKMFEKFISKIFYNILNIYINKLYEHLFSNK